MFPYFAVGTMGMVTGMTCIIDFPEEPDTLGTGEGAVTLVNA